MKGKHRRRLRVFSLQTQTGDEVSKPLSHSGLLTPDCTPRPRPLQQHDAPSSRIASFSLETPRYFAVVAANPLKPVDSASAVERRTRGSNE
ncbi:hypothetical protein F2P81_006059 [Scophthalmus maximus]|uniref:Uncharacterized protein n=1 Tax=Scophthalmus maximus TaxID=52904 RepID=A0A6A4T873_SCOMX|nr:hypothetical protein F2P81_006059 [Scophthalmus maximus]